MKQPPSSVPCITCRSDVGRFLAHLFICSIFSLLRYLCGMRELSVVITVMNEEENIKPLLEAVRTALDGMDYEVILVDDGSVDKTRLQILEYSDDRTILVELRKNYGQSTAMTAGIDYSRGKYVALLDGDLQNDPSDIPAM